MSEIQEIVNVIVFLIILVFLFASRSLFPKRKEEECSDYGEEEEEEYPDYGEEEEERCPGCGQVLYTKKEH